MDTAKVKRHTNEIAIKGAMKDPLGRKGKDRPRRVQALKRFYITQLTKDKLRLAISSRALRNQLITDRTDADKRFQDVDDAFRKAK